MKVPTPHFLLFSESSRKQRQGQWRFLLKAVDGTQQLEAADAEPETPGSRLELLAVVRGLEALDQPSRVTLVTPSKYVHRGLLYGLEEWRTNGWSWEHFGQMVPVTNRDLWQRLDRALNFHELDFQPWQTEAELSESRKVAQDDSSAQLPAYVTVPGTGLTVRRFDGPIGRSPSPGAELWPSPGAGAMSRLVRIWRRRWALLRHEFRLLWARLTNRYRLSARIQ